MVEREGMRERERGVGGRESWMADGWRDQCSEIVCTFSIFSIARHPQYQAAVSTSAPSNVEGSYSVPLSRQCYSSAPCESPLVSLPVTYIYRDTHTRANAFSLSRACVRIYTRPEDHIEDEEGEFSSQWERLREGRRAPVLVGKRRVIGERVRRRRRRHRATQCRRDARPNDTAFAKGYFSPAAISRSAIRLTAAPRSSWEEKEKKIKREGEREREREKEGTLRRAVLTPRKGKEDIEEKSAHRPGILSCHSSTPLKSYWCDGTLSSSWWSTSNYVIIIIITCHTGCGKCIID